MRMIHQVLLAAFTSVGREVHGAFGSFHNLRMNFPLPLKLPQIGHIGYETAQPHAAGLDIVFEEPNSVAMVCDANEYLVVLGAEPNGAPGRVSFRKVRVLYKPDILVSDLGCARCTEYET